MKIDMFDIVIRGDQVVTPHGVSGAKFCPRLMTAIRNRAHKMC